MVVLYNIQKVICISLIIFLSTSLSYSDTGRKSPSLDGILTAGPYYNPASKSYFELVKTPPGPGHARWPKANINAKKRYFKNTQGHLATVKNLASHQFILRHFSAPGPFWIGLQYYCNSRTLKWVDGTNASQSNFSAWAVNWARSNKVRCAGKDYMPVFYTTRTPTSSPRWQASGPEKGYDYYLIEYPTGHE